MAHRLLMLGALAMVSAALVSASVAADVVVVRPGDMNGWVVATQSATGGSPIWNFTVAGAGTPPAGSGSFHFFTDILTGEDPLEKIYLGTNNHAGVALNDITSFKYYTYLDSRRYDGEGGWPDGQPPIIEIITDSGSNPFQQRYFVFKPWGWWGGHSVQKDTWQEWDLMGSYSSARWQMLLTGSTNCFGSWDWVRTRYPGTMRLSIPVVGDYTQGYTPDYRLRNQSGTCLSIKVGSGKAQEKMINQDTRQFESKAWWRESCGIDAYADKLVIGINGVETVYDFEPEFTMEVGINPSSCRDRIIGRAKDKCIFVAFGRVMDNPTSTQFFLDDGGGKKLPVLTPDGNSVRAGEFWRAKGTLVWNKDTGRYDLHSSVHDIIPIYIPGPF